MDDWAQLLHQLKRKGGRLHRTGSRCQGGLAPFRWQISHEAKPGARTKSGGLSGAGRAQLRDKRTFAPPGVEVRVLLHHAPRARRHRGQGYRGQTIIQLSVNDYVLETLMTFDADAAELEPEPDDQEDGLSDRGRPGTAQNEGNERRALVSGGVD